MSDEPPESPCEPDSTPGSPTTPDRPGGPVGWFATAIGEALQAAFAFAIALVTGLLKALFSPARSQDDDETDA